MKKIFWSIITAGVIAGSCSVADVLEPEDKLSISVVEAVNPVQAEPGDTIMFKFVASTTRGDLSRIVITSGDGIVSVPEKTEFALLAIDAELSLNKDGYFSRPVSTVLVHYPLVMPDDQTLRGKSIHAEVAVTRDDGTRGILNQEFRIINFISNIPGIALTGKDSVWLYNPTDDMIYSPSNYKAHHDRVEMVVYVDANSKYSCLNPAAARTEAIMQRLGYTDYQASEMNETKFAKEETLDFTQIIERDLENLTVQNGVDSIPMANNGMCKFITRDGRKGIGKHLYKSSTSRFFVSKMQVKNKL